MTDDRSTHDLLSRAADAIFVDSDAALDRVVVGARRRTRQTRLVVAAAAAVVLVLVGLSFARLHDQLLGDSRVQPTRDSHTAQALLVGHAKAPLNGEWQTHREQVGAVRGKLRADGIDRATIDRVVGNADQWMVQLTFSPQFTVVTWDPRRPMASLRVDDSYRLRQRGDHQLEVIPGDGARPLMLTYQRAGAELLLSVDGSRPRDSVDDARFLAWTAGPFWLVR